jgi:hypothetical protein
LDEALLVWIAAIESGFARDGEWVAWADRHITRLDEPPLWLLHVCVEQSTKEALAAVYPACGSIPQDVWNRLDWIDLQLGFMYMAFERDKSDLLALLLKAGDLTDRANFRIGCEAFYMLANEIDGKGPTVPSPYSLTERVADLFRPLSELAKSHWLNVQSMQGASAIAND